MPKDVTLAEARKIGAKYREQIDAGLDPREEREKEKQLKQVQKENDKTFSDAYEVWRQNLRDTNRWNTNRKGEQKQGQIARKHILPKIGDKPLKEITSKDAADLLNPVYLTNSSTADKLYTIIRGVYLWADAAGFGNLSGYTPMGESLNFLTKDARAHGKKK